MFEDAGVEGEGTRWWWVCTHPDGHVPEGRNGAVGRVVSSKESAAFGLRRHMWKAHGLQETKEES